MNKSLAYRPENERDPESSGNGCAFHLFVIELHKKKKKCCKSWKDGDRCRKCPAR